MNRTIYFDYIEEKLNTLASRIEMRSKLNLLELNIHSENFFAYLCNIIFDLELENLNFSYQNINGIDLIAVSYTHLFKIFILRTKGDMVTVEFTSNLKIEAIKLTIRKFNV